MREYIRKHTATGPFATGDPVARIADFLVGNGYELVGSAHGEPPEDLPIQADEHSDDESEAVDEAVEDQKDDVDETESESDDEGENDGSEQTSDTDADPQDEPPEDLESEQDDLPDDEAEHAGDEIMVQASLERGKKGAGLRSSNMTELYSHVSVKLRGAEVLIDYLVDVSWQVINEDDERFWTKEAESAIKYAEGRGHLRDFRESEEERAKETRGDFTMMGTWLAILVFFLIFAFFITMR